MGDLRKDHARLAGRIRATRDGTVLEGLGDTTEPLRALSVDSIGEIAERIGVNVTQDSLARTEQLLLRGEDVPRPNMVQYEAIILESQTPVFELASNHPRVTTFAGLPPKVVDRFTQDDPRTSPLVETVAKAVARIDVPERGDTPYAGTAFLVGPDLMLTNRHVAAIFSHGVGPSVAGPFYGARCSFLYEQATEPGPTVTVRRVEWVHPFWDLALLRVEGDELANRVPLSFEAQRFPLSGFSSRPIAVIGYPKMRFTGSTYDDVQKLIFGATDEIKRFQPGLLRRRGRTGVPNPARPRELIQRVVLDHDSSTLGGNSGSVVFDLETGAVLGIHFGGNPDTGNYAVPASELLRDPKFASNNPTVHGERVAGVPVWAGFWTKPDAGDVDAPLEPDDGGAAQVVAAAAAAVAVAEAQPPAPTAPPVATGFLAARLGPWWMLSPDEQALQDLWAVESDRPRIRADIQAALAPEMADDLLALLGRSKAEVEAVFGVPVVVYLHGIMGGHLRDADTGSKYWFGPLELFFSPVASRLRLQQDGSVPPDGPRVAPSGHLDLFYGEARRAWMAAGLLVYPFSFDWRLPFEVSADQLHTFVTGVRQVYPTGRIVIAAHSMGGVVSAVMASRHADWAGLIDAVAFVGSPLGGSFAPIDAVRGRDPLLRTLAGLSPSNTLRDYQRLSATLPGLAGMLPDPQLFPGTDELYEHATWTGEFAPAARVLSSAAAIKAALRHNPLYTIGHAFVGGGYATVNSHEVDWAGPGGGRIGPGDGTVPLRAAALREFEDRIYNAEGRRHSDMMKHRGVINAVTQLALNEPITALARFTGALESLTGGLEVEGLEALGDPYEELGREVARRFQRGQAGRAEFEALFSPEGGLPPRALSLEAPGESIVAEDTHLELPEAEIEAPTQPSGEFWVESFPTDRTTAGLVQPFRRQVQAFIIALEQAGVRVRINATRRPYERAWLMRGAWDVAHGADPASIGTLPNVAIDWTCGGDMAEARRAATAMVRAYGLAVRPALTSRHISGLAIDMTLRWEGRVEVVDAAGGVVLIDADAGVNNNEALIAVGLSYGVLKLRNDPPHWSVDGR